MIMNCIIGTAGHVDHGKTALIKALCGIDTDRLEEEKKRGITIDLGFAHMDIPQIGRVGIVDVPGHEKFIRNMLAGAGGMDMVLLVVDITEGVMPQTVEHMDILTILGIKRGILVLNKADLMPSQEERALAREAVLEQLKGTFLENTLTVLVSSKTGEGIEELKKAIGEILVSSVNSEESASADDSELSQRDTPFFMPIDRAFTVKGFGTVVTGTVWNGQIRTGEEYMLYPEGKKTVARSIQVHSEDSETASFGQRVAVNLKDISKEGLQRGHFLTSCDSFSTTMMLDARLSLLESSPFGVKSGSLVHFYYGTGEYAAKVVLMDRDYLEPGRSAYVQLRFKEELIGRAGDSFVIRYLSPAYTIGGGVILDANPVKKRRNKDAVIEGFRVKEAGSDKEKLFEYIKEHVSPFLNLRDVRKKDAGSGVAASKDGVSKDCLDELTDEGLVTVLDEKKVISSELESKLKDYLGRILSAYHQRNVTMVGMPLSEVKEKLLGAEREKDARALINHFLKTQYIKEESGCISLYLFQHKIIKDDEEVRKHVLSLYGEAFVNPPAYNDMKVGFVGAKGFLPVFRSLQKDGEIVKLDERYYVCSDAYDYALEKLRLMAPHMENGEFTLGDYRDRLKCSRKVALAFLEKFDAEGITEVRTRQGDGSPVRTLLRK